MPIKGLLLLSALAVLAACGPQIGVVQEGEQGQVARVFTGDTLQLQSGLRVFLAEIDAPRGDDPYAAQARAAQRGLWALSGYRPQTAHAAAALATRFAQTCTRGAAPYRIVQGAVRDAQVFDRRAALILQGGEQDPPFSIVVFGDSFTWWDGPPLASLSGARVRVRGALGVFHGQPQLCVDDSRQLEVLR
jgi:hypothetical protein